MLSNFLRLIGFSFFLLTIGAVGDVQEVLQDHRLSHHHFHRLPVRLSAGCLIGLQLLAQHVG